MNFRISILMLLMLLMLFLSGCSEEQPVHVSGKIISKFTRKVDDSYTAFDGDGGTFFVASDKTIHFLSVAEFNPLDYKATATNDVQVSEQVFNSVHEGDPYSQ